MAMVAAGADIGGIFRRTKRRLGDVVEGVKDTAGEGADLAGSVGDVLDWWQKNVADPIGGYASSVGASPPNLLRASPGGSVIGLAQDLGADVPVWDQIMSHRTEGYSPFRSWEESGEQYRELKKDMSGVERFAGDVLYDPLTAVGGYGKAVSKIPALGKVGRGISAVESVPGKAVDAALTGAGKATKAVLPEVLTRPSVAERSRLAGEAAFDKARLAGKPLDKATRAYDRAFAKARSGIEKTIRAERDAAKKAGGIGGIRTGIQDVVSKGYEEGVDVFGLRVNPSAINRNLAVAALNNPQYIGGSIAEDTIRAMAGGGSGRRADVPELWKALEGVPGVPSELMRSGRTAAMTGTSKTTGSKIGDVLGGRKATQITEAATDPARRGYVLDIHEQGIKKGLSPDEAMRAAVKRYRREFATPHGETNLDVSAKALLPFWNYQSKRFPYLARKSAEFPGLAETGREYYGQTDSGYLPVDLPGGMQINPLRGSVVNAIPGLTRDHPPFTRGISGDIEQAQDLLARGGFYPGALVNLAVQGVRKLEGQPTELGEVIPDPLIAPLMAAEGLGAIPGVGNLPGVDPMARAFGRFRDTVAGDRFRDYQIAKELAVMGIEPERATPEQRAEASQRAAARELLMTESGNLRYRPQEEQQFKQERQAAAIAAGMPAEVVEGMKGNPISAVDLATNQPYLNAAQKRAIYEQNPQWQPWMQVSQPLRHPEDRAQSADVRAYHDAVTAIDQRAEQELRMLAEGVQAGLVSGKDFRDRRSAIMAWAAASRQQVLAEHPGAQASFDPEQRKQFYERTGRELPGDLPEDVAARRYHEIQVQIDPQTGLPDFDAWRAAREAVLASLDPQTRQYVTEVYPRRRFSDPLVLQMEQEFEAVQQQADQFFAIPKYLGISEEDAAAVDEAARQVEIVRMMNSGLDTQTARMMVLQSNPELARGVLLLNLASRLRNPERDAYLDQHPELRWYLGNLAAPGLGPAGRAA